MDKNNYIKHALQSLDNIEINVAKAGFLTSVNALQLITLSKNTIKNYGNTIDTGDKQNIIDLLHILLRVIIETEEDNFDGVKKIIEQYGYMGKKEFVYQMINRMWDLGKENK